MNPQLASTSAFRPSLSSHLHTYGETCPSCGQEIPAEKTEEISGRIALREREQALAITTKLEQQHEIEKTQADAKAKADLGLERHQSATREAAVREEAQRAAEDLVKEKLAEAEHTHQEQQAAWQKLFEEAEAARKVTEQTGASLQVEMQDLRQASATALENAQAETKARETEIRSEAKQTAESAVAERLAAIEAARINSEAALQERITEAESSKIAAEQKGTALLLQLDELQKASGAEVAKVKEVAATEAARIRQEATDAAEALLRDNLAANEKTVADANARALGAESKLLTLTEQHTVEMAGNLNSQREVMEKAKDDAVNAEKAKAFEETQRLSTKVNEVQRALEKKTNEELGEGAEIDVFEALKKDFPDDRITRIAKGVPGADILHVVMLRGKECGTIIYDSKNHNAFRNEHVTKLKADQLAAKAEHAILSTHKFPQGTRQLHMQDGILLANPARVVLIAVLIRQHLLQIHTLRLSGIERENKTVALYEFITSERCTQLLRRVDERADELLDQQAKEVKWHENNWKKQGEAIRGIQRANADLENEISGIIGTSADDDVISEHLKL
ncbi:MAG: hypothetical protein M3Y72_17750 [Acidobacteriota bacterium]|nr:hypothetical protein [Acidobacteriota bacterium]